MSSEALTRRMIMQGSGTLVGSAMMRAGLPTFVALSQAACSAKEEAAAFENLSFVEAREIIAIAARILPTTDTPGATEAGAANNIPGEWPTPARHLSHGRRSGEFGCGQAPPHA